MAFVNKNVKEMLREIDFIKPVKLNEFQVRIEKTGKSYILKIDTPSQDTASVFVRVA